MGRKSIPKVDNKVAGIGTIDNTATSVVTPKKGRKAVKVEASGVTEKAEKGSPAKTTRKGKVEIESDEESIEAPKESPAKIKINRVKSKIVLDEDKAPKQKKAPAKRKTKTEDDEEDDEEDADDTKAKKKRKTKEEKEAEAMPLAVRTVIGTLKKAMHIGAHVSGAGGIFHQ
jgi:AP endonuclease-1